MLSFLSKHLPVLEDPSCHAVASASEHLANAERIEAGGRSQEAGWGVLPYFQARMWERSARQRRAREVFRKQRLGFRRGATDYGVRDLQERD